MHGMRGYAWYEVARVWYVWYEEIKAGYAWYAKFGGGLCVIIKHCKISVVCEVCVV